MFPETFTSASRKTERPFQAQSVSHRTDKTSLESKRTPRDFPRRLFLYPVPSAAARTAPNGVKERASFCLVFRSLNTTSSHIYRMFSMGYRRAKSTQGNTNFYKRIFWQTTSGSLPEGLNSSISNESTEENSGKNSVVKLVRMPSRSLSFIGFLHEVVHKLFGCFHSQVLFLLKPFRVRAKYVEKVHF